jgi:hypothetical protein
MTVFEEEKDFFVIQNLGLNQDPDSVNLDLKYWLKWTKNSRGGDYRYTPTDTEKIFLP